MWLVEELLWGALRKPPHPWPQGLGLAGPTLLIPDRSRMQGLLGQLTRVLFMAAPRDGSGAARKAACPADRKL